MVFLEMSVEGEKYFETSPVQPPAKLIENFSIFGKRNFSVILLLPLFKVDPSPNL
jgi:hypothetical protein